MKHTEDNIVNKMIEEARHDFRDHIVTIKTEGDVTVIDWKKSNASIEYAVRYLLHDHHVYISGDLGYAVFNLTWDATIKSFKDINIDYMLEKLETVSDPGKYVFDNNLACQFLIDYLAIKAILPSNLSIKEMKDYINDHEFDDNYYEEPSFELFKKLYKKALKADSISEWEAFIDQIDWQDYMDEDFSDWYDDSLYNSGTRYSYRVIAYVVGLWMINEQINEEKKEK